MKTVFKYPKLFSAVFVWGLIVISGSTFAETPVNPSVKVEGVIIIINDLVIVNDAGLLATHKTKRDSDLNVQAKVSGNVRVREDGYWIYKKGLDLEFINAKMYLSNEVTAPVTLEVLTNELNEEETVFLPVLLKGEHDTEGKRFQMQINGSMMAGIFLPLNNSIEDIAKK